MPTLLSAALVLVAMILLGMLAVVIDALRDVRRQNQRFPDRVSAPIRRPPVLEPDRSTPEKPTFVARSPQSNPEAVEFGRLCQQLRGMVLGDEEKMARLIERERQAEPNGDWVSWAKAAIIRLGIDKE